MKVEKLDKMKRGWFVGDFEPSLHKTNEVEVAVQKFKKGQYEEKHHHKIAKEITVINSGAARMNGKIYQEGDIIIIEPNEATDFFALSDVVTTVVKLPGASNDKYLGEPISDTENIDEENDSGEKKKR
jgi:quercetin dioxygenase-like cupin family protein